MKKQLIALAAIALGAMPVLSQENYGQWSKYRTLTLNTTSTGGGANMNGNVTNIPVLVRLTSAQADVFTQAAAAGADVRFTKADGVTRLAHQTVSWNAVGQKAEIWVLLDSAKSNNNTQSFRIYWGKAGAADSSSASSTFRTGDNFQGVWHFETDLTDATANGYNGTNTGTTDTSSLLGRGRFFNGTSNSIALGAASAMVTGQSASFTIESWVKWQTIGLDPSSTKYRTVMNRGQSGSSGDQIFLYARNPSSSGVNNPYYSFGYYTGSSQTNTTNDARDSLIMADSATWTHVVGTYSGSTWRIYNNGILAASTSRTGTVPTSTSNWFIGSYGGTDRWFHGAMDEIRFSTVQRDSNWVRLSYATQKDVVTALVMGATQAVPASAPPTALDYSSDTASYPLGLTITPNVATVTGIVDSFTVAPALPAGLVLNKTSGAITGTPTVLIAAANYVLTAINNLGTAKDTLRLSVVALPPAINYTSSASYLVGAPIAALSPTVIGSVDSFTVSPALPAGLVISKTTGAISGTPTIAVAATNYVVAAINPSGAGKDTISITVVASETYSTWNRHKTLWLNTAANGANVVGNVTQFPILVRFTTTDTVYAQMLSGAADLRFTKTNDVTRLPHQIERWDSAGKTAAVWVLVDTVKGGNGTQNIRMHWGKAAAQNLSSGASVFDTAKGFRGVWHFNEGGTDTAFDATANKLHAVSSRSGSGVSFPTDTAGIIGRAREYGIGVGATSAATGAYFVVPNTTTGPVAFPEDGVYSLSVWVNTPAVGVSREILSKGDKYYLLGLRSGGSQWEFSEYQGSAGYDLTDVSVEATLPGVWNRLVGVRNGAAQSIYLNGVLATGVPTLDNSSTTARVTTQNLTFGRNPDGASRYFRGEIDEINIAGVARSADWIKLEYENQKATQTLVSQTAPPVGIARGGNGSASLQAEIGLTVKALGNGMLFQLSGSTGGGKVNLMDIYGRTVWSASFPAGVSQVSWNGMATNGQAISGGVYLARVTLSAVNGKTKTLEAKVPFTP